MNEQKSIHIELAYAKKLIFKYLKKHFLPDVLESRDSCIVDNEIADCSSYSFDTTEYCS